MLHFQKGYGEEGFGQMLRYYGGDRACRYRGPLKRAPGICSPVLGQASARPMPIVRPPNDGQSVTDSRAPALPFVRLSDSAIGKGTKKQACQFCQWNVYGTPAADACSPRYGEIQAVNYEKKSNLEHCDTQKTR